MTIETEELESFFRDLEDKNSIEKKPFVGLTEIGDDPDFLGDLKAYLNFIKSKPWVKERLLADRESLTKRGFDLALMQAEKNKFGWKSGSE